MHFSHRERAAERMVGLDIGEHGASASLLGFGRGGAISLKAAGSVAFAMDATEDEVADSIRTLWKEGGFASYTVCAGVHSESLLWKRFSYPDLTEDELDSALQLDAEELAQTPAGALAIDKHMYDTESEGREGFYVSIPRKELDRIMRIMEIAKLFPVIVDISAMAFANLYIRFHQEQLFDEAVCAACFDGHHADIMVLQANECVYARSIAAHSTEIRRVSDYMAEGLMEVIEMSLLAMEDFPVKTVCFSGDMTSLDETIKATTKLTGLPVEYWDPLDHIKLTHRARHRFPDFIEGGGKLAGSLGLGLRRVR